MHFQAHAVRYAKVLSLNRANRQRVGGGNRGKVWQKGAEPCLRSCSRSEKGWEQEPWYFQSLIYR